MAYYLILWCPSLFRPRPPGLGLAPVRKILPRSRKGSVMVTVSAHFRIVSLDLQEGRGFENIAVRA